MFIIEYEFGFDFASKWAISMVKCNVYKRPYHGIVINHLLKQHTECSHCILLKIGYISVGDFSNILRSFPITSSWNSNVKYELCTKYQIESNVMAMHRVHLLTCKHVCISNLSWKHAIYAKRFCVASKTNTHRLTNQFDWTLNLAVIKSKASNWIMKAIKAVD